VFVIDLVCAHAGGFLSVLCAQMRNDYIRVVRVYVYVCMYMFCIVDSLQRISAAKALHPRVKMSYSRVSYLMLRNDYILVQCGYGVIKINL
jgi:hypothetical protein